MPDTAKLSVEDRLQRLEDQIAIYQIISGYGFAVDGLNAQGVIDIYAPAGVYEIPGLLKYEGAEQVASIITRETHSSYVRAGCAHTVPMPYIVIEGDRATATSYHVVILNGPDGFGIFRTSACRFELSRRAAGGWQIDHRTNVLLDGSPEGPALLARAAEGPSGSAREG